MFKKKIKVTQFVDVQTFIVLYEKFVRKLDNTRYLVR